MIHHPKSMQTVMDQRLYELRGEAERERLARTALEQSPRTTPLVTLRLRVASTMQMLPSIPGRRQDIGMPRDVRRPAVP